MNAAGCCCFCTEVSSEDDEGLQHIIKVVWLVCACFWCVCFFNLASCFYNANSFSSSWICCCILAILLWNLHKLRLMCTTSDSVIWFQRVSNDSLSEGCGNCEWVISCNDVLSCEITSWALCGLWRVPHLLIILLLHRLLPLLKEEWLECQVLIQQYVKQAVIVMCVHRVAIDTD